MAQGNKYRPKRTNDLLARQLESLLFSLAVCKNEERVAVAITSAIAMTHKTQLDFYGSPLV